jgi:hypothetical protein
MRRAASRTLCAALALLACSRAAADERPRVVVLGSPEEGGVAQLRAELGGLGFEVVTEAVDRSACAEGSGSACDREELEHVARRASAVAAIRLRRSRSGVEVGIVDRVTGKLVLREIRSGELAAGGDRTLVLRAVELLRASLLEVDAPHPSRGEVPITLSLRRAAELPEPAPAAATAAPGPTPAASSPLAPPPHTATRAVAELGPSVFIGPGGLAPMVHTRVALTLERGPLGASAWVLLPALAARLEGPEGRADVRLAALAGGAQLALGPRAAPWSFPVGVGGLAARVTASGTPARGYEGHLEAAWTGGPYASGGFSCAVAWFASVDVSMAAGLLLPPQHVLLGRRQAATLGPGFVIASLGLSLGNVDRGEEVPRLRTSRGTR